MKELELLLFIKKKVKILMLFLPKKNDKLLKGIEFLILKKIVKIAIVKKVVVLKNIAIVINKV